MILQLYKLDILEKQKNFGAFSTIEETILQELKDVFLLTKSQLNKVDVTAEKMNLAVNITSLLNDFSKTQKKLPNDIHRAVQIHSKILKTLKQKQYLQAAFPAISLMFLQNAFEAFSNINNKTDKLLLINDLLGMMSESKHYYETNVIVANHFKLIQEISTIKINHIKGNFQQNINDSSKIQDLILNKHIDIKQSKKMRICYQMAYAFFNQKRYEEALIWLTFMQYTANIEAQKNAYYSNGLLLSLILQYEMGNDNFITNQLPKSKATLQKMGCYTGFEALAIAFFKNLTTEKDKSKHNNIFEKYKSLFAELQSKEAYLESFSLLNFYQWLKDYRPKEQHETIFKTKV